MMHSAPAGTVASPPPTVEHWKSLLAQEADVAAAISVAVNPVDGLAALWAGEFGRVGTFLGARAIPGVRLDDDIVQVHIVAHYGFPLSGTAAAILEVVAPLLNGRSLQVVVQDVLLPGEHLDLPAADPGSA